LFAILVGTTIAYLGLVEPATARFYRNEEPARRSPRSHRERRHHRIHRRAARFRRTVVVPHLMRVADLVGQRPGPLDPRTGADPKIVELGARSPAIIGVPIR
jgi:hypothetical protein